MPDLTEQLRALVAKWRAKSDADYPSRDEATGMAPEIRYDAEGRCEQLDECADELSALLAAAEGVERDAARYRWLREHDNADLLAEDVIDEAIDSMRDSGEGRE